MCNAEIKAIYYKYNLPFNVHSLYVLVNIYHYPALVNKKNTH